MNLYERINERHDMGEMTIVEAALGLVSESGEVAQLVRKREFETQALNVGEMLTELSDVLHYLVLACSCYGVTLADLGEINRVKLKARDMGNEKVFNAMMHHYDEFADSVDELAKVENALEVVSWER